MKIIIVTGISGGKVKTNEGDFESVDEIRDYYRENRKDYSDTPLIAWIDTDKIAPEITTDGESYMLLRVSRLGRDIIYKSSSNYEDFLKEIENKDLTGLKDIVRIKCGKV